MPAAVQSPAYSAPLDRTPRLAGAALLTSRNPSLDPLNPPVPGFEAGEPPPQVDSVVPVQFSTNPKVGPAWATAPQLTIESNAARSPRSEQRARRANDSLGMRTILMD